MVTFDYLLNKYLKYDEVRRGFSEAMKEDDLLNEAIQVKNEEEEVADYEAVKEIFCKYYLTKDRISNLIEDVQNSNYNPKKFQRSQSFQLGYCSAAKLCEKMEEALVKKDTLKDFKRKANMISTKIEKTLKQMNFLAEVVNFCIEDKSILFELFVPKEISFKSFVKRKDEIEKKLNLGRIEILAPIAGTSYLGIRFLLNKGEIL